ncbi:hypothetical protein ACWGRF_17545 [Streptomyces zhihengii]|uniref:hypothetical protein n=1 Tax=Streptomyces zhihengii TaxID=1818004 RepID=UPI003642CA62
MAQSPRILVPGPGGSAVGWVRVRDRVGSGLPSRIAAVTGSPEFIAELSIGWNEIDTTAAVTGWEWSEFTPRWSGDHECLEPLVGRDLTEARLLEWRPSEYDLAAGTVAVEFAFGDDVLRITNGLDENFLETGAAHPDYVRHELIR